METDWVENRAKLPSAGLQDDGKEKLDGKVYSIGERDQYTTRLERGKDGASTEVYITQRGMEEVYSSDKKVSQWQARGNDPEKEAIMLQRLMVRFGSSEVRAADALKETAASPAAAASAVAAVSPATAFEPVGMASLREISGGNTIIVVNDAFDRSWRKVGLSIESAGLTVEDKDREKGTYYLRPVKLDRGWFDKLKFWKSNEDTTRRYRVMSRMAGHRAKCPSPIRTVQATRSANRCLKRSTRISISSSEPLMSMRFSSLGSGSEGNALLVAAGRTLILMDCGFGLKDTLMRLARLDVPPEQLSGIVVTHEHGDHISGVARLARKYNLPVWLTHGTLRTQANAFDGIASINEIDPRLAFAIGDIEVIPYAVPHDAAEPVQFVFSDGARRLGVLTDTGCSTAHIEQTLSGCHALVLECNHDTGMLMNSDYPYSLKQRVGGRFGHLNNQDAAAILARLDVSRLQHLIAAISAAGTTPRNWSCGH